MSDQVRDARAITSDGRQFVVDDQLADALDAAQALSSAEDRRGVSADDLLRCLDIPNARLPAPARITPYRDGPYLVRGPFVITDQTGAEIEVSRRTVALCRCGRSQIRPFCDGTHKAVDFQASSGPEGR